MPTRKAARIRQEKRAELLRLPQRLVVRTSDYLQQLADLAGQGSVEPRDYIESTFGLWSGVLAEIGDSLNPEPQRDFGELSPVPVVSYKLRRERGDITLDVPIEVFQRCGEDAVLQLSTDGLIRTYDPRHPLRPALALARDQNVRVLPDRIRLAQRNQVTLKVFGLPATTAANDTFQGVVWGATQSKPNDRFPVIVVVVTVV